MAEAQPRFRRVATAFTTEGGHPVSWPVLTLRIDVVLYVLSALITVLYDAIVGGITFAVNGQAHGFELPFWWPWPFAIGYLAVLLVGGPKLWSSPLQQLPLIFAPIVVFGFSDLSRHGLYVGYLCAPAFVLAVILTGVFRTRMRRAEDARRIGGVP